MSKTIDLQIEKSNTLIKALKHRFSDVSSKGVKMGDLEELRVLVEKLEESGKKTDEYRERYSIQVHTTNNILAQVKEKYKDIKDIIRVNYSQDQWINFGVLDKR
ncbi:MAG: hypothetical protein E7104_05840 [Prevotella sp.]|jgi:adenylosuccinate synthase|nr:hypothetical protein [Prevotella sp.]